MIIKRGGHLMNGIQFYASVVNDRIDTLFFNYKGKLFEFDFVIDSSVIVEQIPEDVIEISIEDLEEVGKNLRWIIDCLKSDACGFIRSIDGTVKFCKPYKGPPIPEEIEKNLFPRYELTSQKKNDCDYFDDYKKKSDNHKKR
jgi:hypothetical protein